MAFCLPHLKEMIRDYVDFVNQEPQRLLIDRKAVMEEIQKYAENFQKLNQNNSKFDKANQSWSSHLHKIRPSLYINNKRTGKISVRFCHVDDARFEMIYHIHKLIQCKAFDDSEFVDQMIQV